MLSWSAFEQPSPEGGQSRPNRLFVPRKLDEANEGEDWRAVKLKKCIKTLWTAEETRGETIKLKKMVSCERRSMNGSAR